MSEAQAKEILLRFDGFARLDPLNWELRLERLLFLSAHLPAQIKSEECLNLLHLNPLQPRLPLQLAQALAIRHPQIAIELLKKVGGRNPEILRSGLELASRISPDTDLLWQITPATLSGLETLGDYAVSKNLFGLAAAAYGQILNDLTPVKAAQKLLSAKQPERVLTLLATNETSSARLLKMEALLQLNHLQEVVDSAEILWGRSPQFENLTRAFPTSGSYEQISKNWVENQNDPVAALSLAEKIFLMPSSERNLELLKQLAQIASETRIHFIYYQTLKERSQLSEAAREAITLSRQILSSGQ
ncbi:MAG: hypothetical protein SFY81_15200 [Verrucomicrobiota bacterium]|nr:hypothetical protein [Verrucomicrobiota bacterium]